MLAVILAGGSGARLRSLTKSCAKPAIPFGGHYRNIDFTLSNCINSGIRRVALATQHTSGPLVRHIDSGWRPRSLEQGGQLEIWPANRNGDQCEYTGTADAVYRNLDLIDAHAPEQVLVLGGDHVYAMHYGRMLDAHRASSADVTVACVAVPRTEAAAYGVVEIDASNRIRAFAEKPDRPPPMAGKSRYACASMGIYLFDREVLSACLHDDAAAPDSLHDFGHSILPRLIAETRVQAHLFSDSSGAPGYWRDVGTIDSYWAANMDLLHDPRAFGLFDDAWPIGTAELAGRPARIAPKARVEASIVARSCTIGGDVSDSVLSENCKVGPGTTIRRSVLLPNVEVGRSCRLDRVVVNSDCVIPDGMVVTPEELPLECWLEVSAGGVVLVDAEALERNARLSRSRGLRRHA